MQGYVIIIMQVLHYHANANLRWWLSLFLKICNDFNINQWNFESAMKHKIRFALVTC